MFTLPVVCIVGNTCPYGLDRALFFTHLARVVASFAVMIFGRDRRLMLAGLASRTGARVQWFTAVKAVLNTLLVVCLVKPPPRFKLTRKATQVCAVSGAAVPKCTAVWEPLSASPSRCSQEADAGTDDALRCLASWQRPSTAPNGNRNDSAKGRTGNIRRAQCARGAGERAGAAVAELPVHSL